MYSKNLYSYFSIVCRNLEKKNNEQLSVYFMVFGVFWLVRYLEKTTFWPNYVFLKQSKKKS